MENSKYIPRSEQKRLRVKQARALYRDGYTKDEISKELRMSKRDVVEATRDLEKDS